MAELVKRSYRIDEASQERIELIKRAFEESGLRPIECTNTEVIRKALVLAERYYVRGESLIHPADALWH